MKSSPMTFFVASLLGWLLLASMVSAVAATGGVGPAASGFFEDIERESACSELLRYLDVLSAHYFASQAKG